MVSLELSTVRHGPYTIVIVSGDLDITEHRRFDEYLGALKAENSRLVVDLAGLTFLDTTGLSVLVRYWQDLVTEGGSLTIARASFENARVLWTTGLIGRIPVVAELTELGDAAGDDPEAAAP